MYLKVLTDADAGKLSELLKDGDWMVLYYAEWCGHCQSMKPEWDKVVQKLKESGNVNVADVKSDVIAKLSHKPEIEGFPTIKMYNNGKSVAKFQDERSAEKLEKFAMDNARTSASKTPVQNNNAMRKSIHNILTHLSIASKTPSKLSQNTRPLNTKTVNTRNTKPVNTKPVSIKPQRLSLNELKSQIMGNNQGQKEMIINLENTPTPQPVVAASPVAHHVSHPAKQHKTHPAKQHASHHATHPASPVPSLELTVDDLLEPPKASKHNTKRKSKLHKDKPKKKKRNSKKMAPAAPTSAPAAPSPAPVAPTPAPAAPVHTPLVNLACSEIRKAKPCKANPKCEFDYPKSKCKNKVVAARHSHTKSARLSATKKNTMKKANTLETKEVFQELIKSFDKIGHETKKDSKLLKKASKDI